MGKETFYFSHDYNTRSDIKIKRMIAKWGYAAYGVFWALIEDLYQNNNEMPLDYETMSYDLRVDTETIKSVIEDFELFVYDGDFFGSKSIEKRLSERDEKSKKASDNARKRWGDNNSRIKAVECIFYVLIFHGENERFIKCGITTESISRRYSGKTANYKYDVIHQKEVSVDDGLFVENEIRNKINKYEPKEKFGGYLECYPESSRSEILKIIMRSECNGNARNEIRNAIK